MKKVRKTTILGTIAAAAAISALAVGPALAVTPASVSSSSPTWSASVLKTAGGTFRNSASSTATYFAVVQLVRTTSSAAPSCSTASGCATTGAQTLLATSGTVAYSVGAGATRATNALSVNCGTSTASRYYWTWVKVSDSSGNVAAPVVSKSLAGKYC